jgi:hypothetical protein
MNAMKIPTPEEVEAAKPLVDAALARLWEAFEKLEEKK